MIGLNLKAVTKVKIFYLAFTIPATLALISVWILADLTIPKDIASCLATSFLYLLAMLSFLKDIRITMRLAKHEDDYGF